MEWQKRMPLHQRAVVRMAAPTKITYLHPRKIPYRPTVRPKCNKTYVFTWIFMVTVWYICWLRFVLRHKNIKPKTENCGKLLLVSQRTSILAKWNRKISFYKLINACTIVKETICFLSQRNIELIYSNWNKKLANNPAEKHFQILQTTSKIE